MGINCSHINTYTFFQNYPPSLGRTKSIRVEKLESNKYKCLKARKKGIFCIQNESERIKMFIVCQKKIYYSRVSDEECKDSEDRCKKIYRYRLIIIGDTSARAIRVIVVWATCRVIHITAVESTRAGGAGGEVRTSHGGGYAWWERRRAVAIASIRNCCW